MPTRGPDSITLICPTCGAGYTLDRFEHGKRYGCKRCSASLLFGKFALVKELGRGGFGVVYKAWQADLQRTVALKFLHVEGQEETDRFLRESSIAGNLAHPNIAPIFEFGLQDGKPFVTMQFIDGTTINRADLPLRDNVASIRDAALALDYAHARGIIHRDIKPHNIMISNPEKGGMSGQMIRRTFIMDFGLARSMGGGGTLTAEGQLLGTPAYMSPEQAEGKPCDTRSDIYSLGATLYAISTKRAPFEANTPVQILKRVTEGSPIPPGHLNPSIDRNLESVILKSMAVNPDARYQTAGEFAADLSSWLAGEMPRGSTVPDRAKSKSKLAPTPVTQNPAAQDRLADAMFKAAPREAADKTVRTPVPGDAPASTPSSAAEPAPTTPVRRLGIGIALITIVLAAAVGIILYIIKMPPPDYVALRLQTTPPDATVMIRGRTWKTPCEIKASELEGDSHSVEITLAGYKARRFDVSYTRDNPAQRNDTLEREASAPLLRVRTVPAGATVRLFPRPEEWPAPCEITGVPPGSYELQISKAGYETRLEKIELVAGRTKDIDWTLEKSARPVAAVISSSPLGARIRINGRDTGKITPLTIYRDEFSDLPSIRVELELDGYDGFLDTITLGGEKPHELKPTLKPLVGSFLVRGVPDGATVLVFAVPPEVKKPLTAIALWSENVDSVRRALAALDPADAPHVAERLKELAARPELKVELPSSPSMTPLKPDQKLPSRGRDVAFDSIRVTARWRILATAPNARDFISDERTPVAGREEIVQVEMTGLGDVTVELRPAVGAFRVTGADGSDLGTLASKATVKAPVGTVTLRYVPPAGDPLLREFTVERQVRQAQLVSFAVNAYLRSAEQAAADKAHDVAVHGWWKLFQEASYPPDEREERAKLPDLIKTHYRLWIDSLAKSVAGDLARKLADAAKRRPEESVAALAELYAAKNAARELRGQAAVALCSAFVALKRPFEAVEWLERAAREKADPGVDTTTAIRALAKAHGPLVERWGEAMKAIEASRPSSKKPGWLGVRLAEGMKVESVAKNSPAEAAGLQAGDVLTAFAKTPLGSPLDFAKAEEASREGEEVEIAFTRGGEAKTATAKLAAKPAAPPPGARLGLGSPTRYGYMVDLDAGSTAEVGDTLEAVRQGEVVGHLRVDRVLAADDKFKNGSLQCKIVDGDPQKGDEIRRAK